MIPLPETKQDTDNCLMGNKYYTHNLMFIEVEEERTASFVAHCSLYSI
jgi:hypothetical protein